MKLDNLVTTYEQSKRIKELGFNDDPIYKGINGHSIYKRYRHNSPDRDGNVGTLGLQTMEVLGRDQEFLCYAYTADELGEILPERVTLSRGGDIREARHIIPNIENIRVMVRTGPTIAQAMGDMLIYLLENNLLPDQKDDE